jgi:excisionase family DNA binding protein
MELKLDVSPALLDAMRDIIREEISRDREIQKTITKYLNRAEAAKILGVSLPTLDKYLFAGDLRSKKINRRVFIREADIKAFVEHSGFISTH